MQEIAMMNAAAPLTGNGAGRPSSAKTGEPGFDRVFSAQQQAGSAQGEARGRDEDTVQPSVQKQGRLSESASAKGEGGRDVTDGVAPEESAADAVEAEVVVDAEVADQVQHTLMQLLKVVAAGQDGEVSQDEISSLVEDLVEQLESTDLHGEEVLAGIDLSSLQDQLDQLAGSDDREALLASLVAEISDQLQSGADLASQLAGVNEVSAAQQGKGGAMAQARDLIQQAFAAVSSERSVPAAETEGDSASQGDLVADVAAAEEIDPRFAGLLGARNGQKNQQTAPLSQQSQAQAQPRQSQEAAVTVSPEPVTEISEGLEKAVVAEMARTLQSETGQPKAAFEGFLSPVQQGQGQSVAHLGDAAKGLTGQATILLPSGQQVAESQIFDQVVTHLSGSANGESGRMVLRLNPAELGSLKLDLVVEGDQVRANIHAQSQQVQEVLERNLPQLRSALAEQGLKIEQFQVDIDRQQHEGSFDNLAGQQYRQQANGRDWSYEDVSEEEMIPLAQLMQTAGGGISLHV